MKQKITFLSGEGDNWLIRNSGIKHPYFPELNFLFNYLKSFPIENFLEIGCSSGWKTKILSRKLHAIGFGIDPSRLAINKANSKRLSFIKKLLGFKDSSFSIGTADKLEYSSEYFDFVFYSFCLYLVDRNLVQKSLAEGHRCLKSGGFLAIKDFDYGKPHFNDYKHTKGIKSFKDDYTDYFIQLGYKIVGKESFKENIIGFELDPDKRVSIWLLYKPK